ncbi:MAG TPA: type VI secretion system accessory protein TagJ [Tepidisphaeraceae bacterium]|jgi:type VI secretion system protein ImpE
MPNALDQFQAGCLNDAISAAADQVRNKPGEIAHRWLLCELLCFAGDLERADKHLDLIGNQDPRAASTAALFRQLIRAETARQQFFTQGRVPEFLAEPSEDLKLRLAASIRIREGASTEAAQMLEQARQASPAIKGQCDGQAFDGICDLDDLTSSVFEVLTSTGKYYWIPMHSVQELEFRAPSGVRDLLWRQARMAVSGGPDGEVYLPALYPNSHSSSDDRLRLGRSTEWTGGDAEPSRGVGQRMFMIGEDARAIGDVTRIEFDHAEGSR